MWFGLFGNRIMELLAWLVRVTFGYRNGSHFWDFQPSFSPDFNIIRTRKQPFIIRPEDVVTVRVHVNYNLRLYENVPSTWVRRYVKRIKYFFCTPRVVVVVNRYPAIIITTMISCNSIINFIHNKTRTRFSTRYFLLRYVEPVVFFDGMFAFFFFRPERNTCTVFVG